MIAVDNLKMQFGSEEILKGISTVFEQGKTNLIIGQSGSGKSVLLKCLIGLLKPVGGRISYHNKPTDQMNLQQQRILREEIGMLFQGGALFDSMTIEENIMFPLRMFSNQSKSKMISRAVMEIGERINFLKNGILVWKGTQEDIFKTNNQDVTDFVYSSNLFKKIRDVHKQNI